MIVRRGEQIFQPPLPTHMPTAIKRPSIDGKHSIIMNPQFSHFKNQFMALMN